MNKYLIILFSILFVSCNNGTNQSLDETIQNSVLESFYNEYGVNLTVNDFKIDPIDQENFKGYIILSGEGETWKYDINVFYNNIEWRWEFANDGEQLAGFNNSPVNEYQESTYEKEATHTCIECYTRKVESKMIHSSGDALSKDAYWVCKDNNMRCINNRYEKVSKYEKLHQQELEYKTYRKQNRGW